MFERWLINTMVLFAAILTGAVFVAWAKGDWLTYFIGYVIGSSAVLIVVAIEVNRRRNTA